jgi:hypothetical protein
MPVRSAYLRPVVSLVLVALAGLLVLFALDVRTWQGTIQRDDLRFRARPDTAGLWRPSTILPGDPAGLALSTNDTTEWRDALQAFWLSRLGPVAQARPDAPLLHAEAEQTLQKLMVAGRTARERSDAANLLGILAFTTPSPSPTGDFRQAIELDPTNAQAKVNLELALRLSQHSKPPPRKKERNGTGFGHGNDVEKTGNGY